MFLTPFFVGGHVVMVILRISWWALVQRMGSQQLHSCEFLDARLAIGSVGSVFSAVLPWICWVGCFVVVGVEVQGAI